MNKNNKNIDKLLKLLLELYKKTTSQDIKRVSKSLFGLLTHYRYTPSDNEADIIHF